MNVLAKNAKRRFPGWGYGLLELALVFLPAFLLIRGTASWVGQDAIRNLAVIWVANILIMAMVLASLALHGTSWKTLGLTFSRLSWAEGMKTFGLSLLVFIFGIAAYLIGPVILAPFTGLPQNADFSRYEFLEHNPGGLLLALVAVYIVSSFGEELIYRAFLITRLAGLAPNAKFATALAVVLSAVFFGAVHYEWGFMGMVQTGFMGLAMGICYVTFKRRLWALVLAHAYMDTILLVQLYLASN